MAEPDPLPRPIDMLPLCGAPDAVAIADGAGTLDYAALERGVGTLAAAFAGLPLMPGARVASWLPKSRTACLLPLAVPRAGLVHVPINPLLKRAQVAHILADSGAELLVTQAGRAASLETGDVPPGCTIIDEQELSDARDPLPPSTADTEMLAAILYTSGSTGRPKGVMLSHANLWLGAASVAHYLGVRPDDRTLCVLPFAFDYGQNQLLSTWFAGGSVVPQDYLAARDVMAAADRYAPTILAGIPPLWVQLLETDWPVETTRCFRTLTNSGGALTPGLVRDLRDRFAGAKLYAMYGLTEAFRATFLDPALIDDHPTAIGTAVPFAEIMVVRGDGTVASDGEPGELVQAGPLVAKGYWRDEQATAARFRPAPACSAYGGMAVWSGDTVVREPSGPLRFIGRADEMIKSAGNRISPTEIEEAMLAGDEVLEAVAIGVPDERLGQAIIAVARSRGDRLAAEAALRARLRAQLPSFMQPSTYIWVDAMPHMPSGKIDRAALKEQVTS